MIPDIKELNFPKIDGKQYATLTHASVPLNDMGEKTITTQVRIDGDIIPDFSKDWEVEFQGEKYIMPLRIPAGAKGNEIPKSTIDLTFQHWAIYQLKRWTFVTMQPIEAGTAIPDEEEASVQLNLKDFCILFGQVLEYYYGDTITIDLNPAWQYDSDPILITISHTLVWNVLIDAFLNKYRVRWSIEAAEGNNNTIKGGERYVIKVGYPTTEVDHIFEYGFDGGLLKVERQVQSEEIRNMLKGRGGDTNIPFRYFKNTDPNNTDFAPDPDWIEELANIYFTNLRGATFRSYVQGWKAAHISKYPGYKAVGENNAYAPWAYRKGFTDVKFHPVEFVADEITLNPQTGDAIVEILPGFSASVKKDSSLYKYGPLSGTLDNNDDIYPTIQGSGLDIAVDVEQIESDDVAASVESDAVVSDLAPTPSVTQTIDANGRKNIEIRSANFIVDSGKTANLDEGSKTFKVTKDGVKVGVYLKKGKIEFNPQTFNIEVEDYLIEAENAYIVVVNALTGEERSASGIPSGTYYFKLRLSLHNTSTDKLTVTVSCETPKVTSATLNDYRWKNTFDIWVKNIWGTSKLSTETAEEYSQRVWKPILGDRENNTAKIVFTSGALVHEDYEFTIVDFPVQDSSKSYNGEQSHWRITLAKSEAELETTGLYVPSTKKQGKAGDTFAFIGTEMTHVPYVVDAEKRLDDWKKDQLLEVKEIKPTFVVTTDRVRLNNEGKPNALINQLRVGNSIRLADKRFIQPMGDRAYETLYLQSITYTYREPSSDDAALNPDVEIVLGNEYATSANPVSMMQGEISALQKQVGSISNIEQIVRAVSDRLYLRKDGISDRSLSPTQFFSLLTSGDFRAGLVGGAGWGFYKDENGNWVLETDRLNVRQEMSVNTLVINQAEGRGGMEIDTAAFMEVSRVIETGNSFVCYFDQKDGSLANLFRVGDVAFCNRWTPENAELKFYKRRVVAVGVDSVTLTKPLNGAQRPSDWIDSGVNGTGIPAEKDNIIHFGSYTDKTRQYVKVRDVVGGGYERYIEELNSVNAAGVEYYFVGKQAGQSRWFVGNKDLTPYSSKGDGSYIEYINRKFNLNNVSLSVNTTIGDKTIDEYIKLVSPPVEQEDIEDFVNNIVNPKIEGIQDQIDGVIETWFYNGVPTLTNYPASDWNTDALKAQHLGDLYYDNDTGTAYRFSQKADKSYYWNVITDDAITKALAAAQKAQDTADGKRRTFTSQPTPPYDKGDIWVNATYPAGNTVKDAANGKYVNDILRCNTSRATGSFAIGDWGLASNYTDDTAALAAAAAAQAAKNAADAAQSAANAAQSSVTTLNNYVNGAFKDGIIDETEASGIANYINIVNADKERIDGTYQTLYANAYLSATGKAALKTAHDDVAAKITALINAINSAIADSKVTAAESAAVDSAFSAFSTSNKAFSAAVETANEEIQQTLKSAADAAKTAADNAKAAADAAKGVADAAKDRLDSWAADGVISPTEKQAIKDEIARIDADKAHITAEYTRYGLGTPTDYNAAHSAYRAQLVTLSASTPENITIPPYFSANQTAYYNQRTAALSAIATAAKKYADDVAKEEATKATDAYKYLKESLLNAQQESTEISGGLILSTMMALGYTENGVKKILSGMNGSYVSSLGGRTIASWYGGHMLDLFDKNDNRIANPTGQEATSLIRMDGSFYFANGNIGGRTDGSGWLAGNNITWDASGAITFGNGIHIDLGSGNSTTLGGLNSKLSGVETTVGSVLTLVNALSNVLVPVNSSGARVAWDSADLWAVKSVKGFYSEEFISARGMNGQSSSISKYLTDLLDVGISAPASGQALVYNGSKWVNQAIQTGLDETALASYLTTNNYAKKSDIPSLSPYLKVDGSNGTAAGLTAMINKLQPGDANITDSTMLVTSHATAPDGNNYYRRSATYLWGYIKGKADSVYATSGHTHNVIINGETKTISATGAPAVNLGTFLTSHQSLANYYTKSEVDAKDKRLTTYYTSRPASANVNFGNNAGLYTFLATTSMTTGKPGTDAHILHMEWDNSSSWAGQIAVPTTGNMQWRCQNGTTWQAWRTLLDSSNFNTLIGSNLTAYVKKAGDTMSGILTISHASTQSAVINSTTGKETFLRVQNAGSNKSCFGWHPTYGTYLYHSVGAHYIGIRDNGSPYFDSSLIWHAGNDGSGSGLDADLLDGVHNGEVTAKKLTVATPTTVGVTVATAKTNMFNAIKGAVFGNVAQVGANLIANWSNDSYITVGSSVYSVINVTPQYNGDSYGQYLLFHYASYNPKLIGRNNGAWTAIKTFAFLDDTVANANSLGGKAASQYVTTDTAQTISGAKTFSGLLTIGTAGAGVPSATVEKNLVCLHPVSHSGGPWYINSQDTTSLAYLRILYKANQALRLRSNGELTASSFVKSGGTSSQFLKADGSVDANSYLTTGSAASIYLPKTGGTIKNGATTVPLAIDSDSTSETGLKFSRSGTSKAWVGYDSSGARLYNYACKKGVGVKDNGTLYFQSDVVWHAGNDGSGSGLDADLLDGVHNGDLTARTFKLLRHSSSTSNTSNLAIIKEHYAEIPVEAPCTLGLSHGSLSMAFGWRLGGSYNSVSTAYCGWFISDYGMPRWIGADNGTWKSETFAFLSSNVASATKLATARTLWGQSFNGNANVSGSMTGVVDITASGLIKAQRFSGLNIRIECDNSGASSTHGSEINNFNNSLYLQHHTSNSTFICTGGGNVGIGTTSPSYKLHVTGSIRADSWIRTSGATGWYNDSYYGGWYMTDSTWIKNYNSKKLQILGNTDYNAILVSSGGGIAVTDYAGSSWNNGIAALNVGVTDNSNQTPLLLAYRKGKDYPISGGANRLFALELLNSGTTLRYCFGGAYKFEMTNGGVFHAVGGIYSDGYVSARGQNTSSDERLKNILRPLSLNVRDIANAPSVEFIWKKDGIKDVGSIAQYWRKLIPQLAPDMPDGSMGLQYGKTALLASISNAREIVRIGDTLLNVSKRTETLEQKVSRLESENRELKSQISQLKTQLA